MRSAIRYIVYGQLCLYAGLLVCAVVKPHGLLVNDGISYYGNFRATIIPYAFALLGGAYFSIRAAEHLAQPPVKPLRYAFTAFALLAAGELVTPAFASQPVDALHRVFGIALFSLQLLVSIWLVVRLRYAWQAVALALVELIAGIAAFLYLAPAHGLLLESQVVFQTAFAALAIYALTIMPTTIRSGHVQAGHSKTKFID